MNIIERMKAQVKESELHTIIRTYTDEPCPEKMDMHEHIETWARNKEHIFKLFGNKLTIEKEVDVQLPSETVKQKLTNDLFKKEFSDKKFILIRLFLNTLSGDEIRNNILERDFVMFDTTLKKGMKVSKCFKFLTKKEFLYDANVKYSMFLQSLAARGVAVISIDPKDYLTMSANNSGWRSCHAPDGEYRAGQISYMLDKCSTISYIKSKDGCCLDDGTTHTNKIWRQIVLFNPDDTFAMQARQYPNDNDANAAGIGEMLKNIFEEATKSTYKWVKYEANDSTYTNLQENNQHMNGYLFYNDIHHCAFCDGYVVMPEEYEKTTLEQEVDKKNIAKVVVGESVPCLCGCGELLHCGETYFSENDNNYDDED